MPKARAFHSHPQTLQPIKFPPGRFDPKYTGKRGQLSEKKLIEDPISLRKVALRTVQRLREDKTKWGRREEQYQLVRSVTSWRDDVRRAHEKNAKIPTKKIRVFDQLRQKQMETGNNEGARPTWKEKIAQIEEAEIMPNRFPRDWRTSPQQVSPRRPSSSSSQKLSPRKSQSPEPLNLGLERINNLLDKLGNPQDSLKVVHVAGTNGKGSVCAYLTSALSCSDLKVGQFISPHLIDRWDCISINNVAISQEAFLKIENKVKHTNKNQNIDASSFEVLTACAILYFTQEGVDIAVIETGMGGLLDATNVFKSPLVTAITSISLDHTGYLGPTIEDVAKHKAGIIKPASPVVTISNHQPTVQQIISDTANSVNAPLHIATGQWRSPAKTRFLATDVSLPSQYDSSPPPVLNVVPGIPGPHQSSNIAVAIKTLSLLSSKFLSITAETVQKGIASAKIPGRMEWVRFELKEGKVPMLLDGAHNPASCAALADVVNELRGPGRPVVWVVAFSRGRDVRECLGPMVKKGDSVATVEFGRVDGMEWVKPVKSMDVLNVATELTGKKDDIAFGRSLPAAIRWAVTQTVEQKGILVGTGSLYLVGDVHRLRSEDPDFA